jgi:hypothetical protein
MAATIANISAIVARERADVTGDSFGQTGYDARPAPAPGGRAVTSSVSTVSTNARNNAALDGPPGPA